MYNQKECYKKWYELNKEKRKPIRQQYYKKYKENNKDKIKEKGRIYRLNNRDKINKEAKLFRLKKKYGITPEQFKQMKIAQDNRCAICGNFEIKKQRGIIQELCVDHDHKTGKIRQLLCHNCNIGLGIFNDDKLLLLKASNYLNKWSTNNIILS